MNLTLKRDAPGNLAMRGECVIAGIHFQTLEDLPGGEAEGEPVPAGEYRLVPHDSKKYGRIWAMVNPTLGVYHQPGDIPKGKKGRFACLFMHSGNDHTHTLGCVLAGLTRGPNETVLRSREAVAKLKEVLPWVEHSLTILDA